MNFIVSFFLALAASIATLALQLCNDGLNADGRAVATSSVFAIMVALYFVDYKKIFAISRSVCNVLLVVAVLSQIGALFRSRQDFLAFSIANILALLQAVVFFQKKTTRIACQILVISLIEVAVGCVFQRSLYFVGAVPFYVLFAFLALSLLFLKGERDYYATNIALKERFAKRKKARVDVKSEKNKEEFASNATNLAFQAELLKKVATSNKSEEKLLFFACPSSSSYGITFEYFRRFALWGVSGALCSALFFCLFPRFNQIGYGALQFEPTDWGASNVPAFAKTGFSNVMELGDLAPTIDSYEQVATVQFRSLDDDKRSETLDSNSPVYFRGVALARYDGRLWSEVDPSAQIQDADLLIRLLRTQTALKSVEDVLPQELLRAGGSPRSRSQNAPQRVDHRGSPNRPFSFPPANRLEYLRSQAPIDKLFRAPLLGYNPKYLSDVGAIAAPDTEDERRFFDELKAQIRPLKDALKYDSKSDLLALKMETEPSSAPYVFHIRPFFIVKGTTPLSSTFSSSVVVNRRFKKEFIGKPRYWFITPAFHNGRQDALTPNQENVWSFLPQYLTFDAERFTRLRELARQWDSESGYEQNDFVARARYLESKLRDSGEFKYNRSGVLRDQSLDPLEDFVSVRREGHCEYFAGALTIMLRAVGIPARVVVGYACNVDSSSKKLVVRQSDAHSWVEAYIPPKQLSYAIGNSSSNLNVDPNAKWPADGGWLRLDPTPASDREAEQPNAIAVSAHDLSSLVQTIGRDFILNFNGARQQRRIYQPVVGTFRAIVQGASSLKNAFSFGAPTGNRWKFNYRFFLFLLAFCALTFVLYRRFRKFNVKFPWKGFKRVEKNERRAELSVDKGAVSLFLQIARALERKLGIKKRQGETPLEFATRCLQEEKRLVSTSAPVGNARVCGTDFAIELTKAYYLASFGNVPLSPQEKKRWKEFLRSLK